MNSPLTVEKFWELVVKQDDYLVFKELFLTRQDALRRLEQNLDDYAENLTINLRETYMNVQQIWGWQAYYHQQQRLKPYATNYTYAASCLGQVWL